MIGRVEETSASFEARSAPRLYPTEGLGVKFPGPTRLVSRVTPVHTAVRNCTRDEGRSFEVGLLRDQLGGCTETAQAASGMEGGAKLNLALERNYPSRRGDRPRCRRRAANLTHRFIRCGSAGRQCRWSTCTERENLAGDAKGKG